MHDGTLPVVKSTRVLPCKSVICLYVMLMIFDITMLVNVLQIYVELSWLMSSGFLGGTVENRLNWQ